MKQLKATGGDGPKKPPTKETAPAPKKTKK
jgi:hypothetical protein